jgi:hypothetical protein
MSVSAQEGRKAEENSKSRNTFRENFSSGSCQTHKKQGFNAAA